MNQKNYCYCGQDLPCPRHGCGVDHQPKPEVPKCKKCAVVSHLGKGECHEHPASTEEWEKELVHRWMKTDLKNECKPFELSVADWFIQNIRSHDQQLRQRIVEWAADERDKADAHYAKEQDDYSQGYFMAMNTVMKHLETPPSSPTYK